MKTITATKPFETGASLRTPLVRQLKESVEELLRESKTKLESFELNEGNVTMKVPDEGADVVTEFMKKMNGVEVDVASSAAEVFLAEFNRRRSS
jgi:hypothetical protein